MSDETSYLPPQSFLQQHPAPYAPTKQGPPNGPRRTGFAAAVVAASLVVGGSGGYVAGMLSSSPTSSGALTSTSSSGASASAAPAVVTDGSVESVAKALLPSVVQIDVSGSQGSGSGSGIILSADGKILTNNHVAAIGSDMTVLFNNGTHVPAKVIGTDPLTDLAVIQAQGVSGLKPASIGSSGSLQVGQSVVAIGSPFGLASTVTSGIVSALNRPIDVSQGQQSGNLTVYPAIQTDAPINPGNSGGALVDMAGRVIGINASIQTATNGTGSGEPGSIGLGFAIPIDEAMPIARQIIAGQTPTHARMGVAVSDASAANDPIGTGARIGQISPGSAAAKAGLSDGDVITKVNDQIITDSTGLIATIRAHRPGDSVTVTYLRGGQTRTADITLESDQSLANS